jgi:hypothetical protein
MTCILWRSCVAFVPLAASVVCAADAQRKQRIDHACDGPRFGGHR